MSLFFKRLFRTYKPLSPNDDFVDNHLLLIIYKNADEDSGRVRIRDLGFLWEKATGSIWEYKLTFSRYCQQSDAYTYHRGRRAGSHEVSLAQDLITISKVNHLIQEEQMKYRNLLFTFIKKGNLLVVKNLIEDKSIDDNLPDKNGDKPVHYAVRYSKLNILKYLIESRGIDIDEKNKFGETPVFFACKTKTHYCLEYLVEHGASTTIRDGIGILPLFFPIKEGRLDHVKVLLSPDNMNEFLCANDYSPLQLAAHWSQLEIVEFLLRQRQVDIFLANADGRMAVNFARDERIRETLDARMRKFGWQGGTEVPTDPRARGGRIVSRRRRGPRPGQVSVVEEGDEVEDEEGEGEGDENGTLGEGEGEGEGVMDDPDFVVGGAGSGDEEEDGAQEGEVGDDVGGDEGGDLVVEYGGTSSAVAAAADAGVGETDVVSDALVGEMDFVDAPNLDFAMGMEGTDEMLVRGEPGEY